MTKRGNRLSLGDYFPVSETDERQILVPGIPSGRFAELLGDGFHRYVSKRFPGFGIFDNVFEYNPETEQLEGSHFLGLNVFGQWLRRANSRFDVTSHRHLTEKGVAEIVESEGVYADAQDALVLRAGKEFLDKRDEAIFNQLSGLVERGMVGNLDRPVLLKGLEVKRASQKEIKRYGEGYGLSVVPTKGFEYTHDEKQFGAEGGWYEGDYAVSGLFRNDAGLSASRDLADSDRGGRVVLVSGEASRADFGK